MVRVRAPLVVNGANNMNIPLPYLPKEGLHYLTFKVRDKLGNKLPPNTAYILLKPDGKISRGVLGEKGLVQTKPSESPEEYIIIVDNVVPVSIQQMNNMDEKEKVL